MVDRCRGGQLEKFSFVIFKLNGLKNIIYLLLTEQSTGTGQGVPEDFQGLVGPHKAAALGAPDRRGSAGHLPSLVLTHQEFMQGG